MYGKNRFVARLAPVALSRFVDRVYQVPSLVGDWWRGSFAHAETEISDDFICEVLKICENEKIDVVFPLWNPQFFAFSRNKRQFSQRGITLSVPEWPVLVKLMAKYRLMQEAPAAGFPCPKTFRPETREKRSKLLSVFRRWKIRLYFSRKLFGLVLQKPLDRSSSRRCVV